VYALKTGYCAYHDPERLGAVLITLRGDAGIAAVDVEFRYTR
jgi:hypothetical protein